MKTQTHHPQTFRSVPTHSKPLDSARLEKLLQQQLDLYKTKLLSSGLEYQLAVQNIPLGAHSTFQSFDPYPISIASAKGAWMTDVDGRKMLDLSMGFGSMLVGHLNPEVVSEVRASLDVGTYIPPHLQSLEMLLSGYVEDLELNKYVLLTRELNQLCMQLELLVHTQVKREW